MASKFFKMTQFYMLLIGIWMVISPVFKSRDILNMDNAGIYINGDRKDVVLPSVNITYYNTTISREETKRDKFVYSKQTGNFASGRKLFNISNLISHPNKRKPFDITAIRKWADELFDYENPQFISNLSTPCFNVQAKDKAVFRSRYKGKVNKLSSHSLVCLPSIYIIGVSKCGTTDLYAHLLQHQHVIGAPDKEPHFWEAVRSFNSRNTFQQYVENYDTLAAVIENCYLRYDKNFCTKPFRSSAWNVNSQVDMNILGRELQQIKDKGGKCPLQVIDGTTTLINYEHGAKDRPGILASYRIKSFIPNPKIIIFLRDPVTRIVSDFYFFVEGKNRKTKEYLHKLIVNGIAWWKECVSKLSETRCAFGTDYKGTGLKTLGDGLFSWGDSDKLAHNGANRVRLGMYVIYVQKWLEVYNLNSELYVQTLEEYSRNSKHILSTEILPFLEMAPFSKESLNKLSATERSGHKNEAKGARKQILPETVQLLTELYKPYNKRLAELLQDDKYLWNK